MNYFKKINWKLLNLSLWAELIIVYLMPFKKIDDFRFTVGFPIPFLTIYNTTPNVSPLHSMLFNPNFPFFDSMFDHIKFKKKSVPISSPIFREQRLCKIFYSHSNLSITPR